MNCFLVSTTLANDKASCVKAFNTLQGAIYSFVAFDFIMLYYYPELLKST